MKAIRSNIAKTFFVLFLFLSTVPSFAQDSGNPPPDPNAPPQQDQSISPQDQQLDAQEEQQVAPPDQPPASIQTFYNELAPYGQWVNYGNYGYVWIPNAGPNFVPYSTSGHWIYTDFGWTWVSDFPWGWAPFHYGRWAYDNNYGWFWVPDVNWGPAWVCWRSTPGYYGWAPLAPGISINAGYTGNYGIPENWWIFVGAAYITSPYVNRYYLPRDHCIELVHRSTLIYRTNYDNDRRVYYSAGPQREEVQRFVPTPIRTVEVRQAYHPEQRYDNQHLHLYKPTIAPVERTAPQPAPSRPVQIRDVPRINEPPQPQNRQPVRQQNMAPQQRAPQAPRNVPMGGNRSNGGGGRKK